MSKPPSKLITQPHLHLPGQTPRQSYEPGDRFYAQLIAAHEGLTEAQSELLNARLLLLLANQVGDLRILEEALSLARAGVPGHDASHART